MVFHLAADLPAVAAWHHHVEEDDGRLLPLEDLHGLDSVVGDGDLVATRFQIVSDDVRVVLVIVDNEDGGELWVGHRSKVVREQSGGKTSKHVARQKAADKVEA